MGQRISKANKSTRSAWLWSGLWALVLFIVICLYRESKTVTMTLIPITLLLGILGFSELRERLTLPVLFLFLITAMGGISCAYAVSGKFALQGALALTTALCCALLLLLIPDRGGCRGMSMAFILAAAAGLISLFSIDLASTRLLSLPFGSDLSGVETGVRITSIFGAPNVFAGCVGIGVLLSLMLASAAEGKWERRAALVLLFVNSMGFLLAFSMGATAAIALAFPAYLLLERKDRRRALLVRMALTLTVAVVFLIPASLTALGHSTGFQPIPMLCVAVGSVALCFLDRYAAPPLEKFLSSKQLLPILLLLLVALLVFGILALSWTGPVRLSGGESLNRAIYPAPGDYRLSAQGGEFVFVTVKCQNRQDVMMHTETLLYTGRLSDAAFTVPEDSQVVWLRLSVQTDTTLKELVCVGKEQIRVPLKYMLLPGFVSNRLQGLLANQNAIQRLVFMADGLKLFVRQPITGLGLGAFEATLGSVQDFYYETKYVHNHYIQTLLETGLIGLVLFLGLFGVSAILVLRSRKKESPFAAGLGALLVFMGLHAGVEVAFSSGIYLPLAFGVFALLGLCCGSPLRPKWLNRGFPAALFIFLLAGGILLGCNLRAQSLGKNAATLEQFQKAAELDPFEWTDYAISYVANAPASDPMAERYAQKLEKQHSNTLFYHLAQYYFASGRPEKAMAMLQKQMEITPSSSAWWNTCFALIYEFDDGSDRYLEGIQMLNAAMTRWDETHMGSITLEDEVQEYLASRQ